MAGVLIATAPKYQEALRNIFAPENGTCQICGNAGQARRALGEGQQRKGTQIRDQIEIRFGHIGKTVNGGGVEGNAVFHSMGQLAGHNRNIFLYAEAVAEGKPDKLDIAFFHKLQQLGKTVFHTDHCIPPGAAGGMRSFLCIDDEKVCDTRKCEKAPRTPW